MTPLPDSEIRARTRPGAISLVWALRLLLGFLIALPIARLVGASPIADFARGDALLFDGGGLFLVELFRSHADTLRGAAQSMTVILVVASIASLVTHALLLVALAHRERLRIGEWGGRALEHFPAFVLMGGLVWLAQGLIALVVGSLGAALGKSLSERISERGADLAALSVFAFGALLMLLVGLAHDLGRAAAVRKRVGGWQGLGDGFRTFARRPFAALISWAVPAFWTVAVLAAAAIVVERLSVEREGSLRVVAAFIIHQLAVLALVALRATWLGRALVLVGGQ